MFQDEYENADSGASQTFLVQAGNLKKGGYIVIKNKPCKIIEITSLKPGKHGHAKATIVATDIFTDKKYEFSAPSSHNVDCPNVTKKECNLLDVEENGQIYLIHENNKIDLKVPDQSEFFEKLKESYDSGKNILITVISAMGMERAIAFKEDLKNKSKGK